MLQLFTWHEYEASDPKRAHANLPNYDVDLDQHHAGYDHNFTVSNVNRGSAQMGQ